MCIRDSTGTFEKGDVITSFDGSVISYDSATQILEIQSEIEHFSEGDPIVTANGSATAHQCVHAEASATNGAIVVSNGDFTGLRGQLDEEQMKIQDSRFYQDYSYVVKVFESFNFFRYSIKFNFFGYIVFSIIAKNILGISENVENAGKLLSDIAFDNDFNNIKYLHLSNKLVFYKKHKLIKSEVSEEASKKELALRLWSFSEELCRSFGFVSLNI